MLHGIVKGLLTISVVFGVFTQCITAPTKDDVLKIFARTIAAIWLIMAWYYFLRQEDTYDIISCY